MNRRALALIPLALAIGACAGQSSSNGAGDVNVICTMEARSSFAVTVVDSLSGAKITQGATVRVTEGAFSATLNPPMEGDSVFSGEVYERPGTYDLSITHAGHLPWEQRGVRVARDECHVIPARITARLRPAS